MEDTRENNWEMNKKFIQKCTLTIIFFICLGFCALFSLVSPINTYAEEYSVPLVPTGTTYSFGGGSCEFINVNNSSIYTQTVHNINKICDNYSFISNNPNNPPYVFSSLTSPSYKFNKDNYYTFTLTAITSNSYEPVIRWNVQSPVDWFIVNSNLDFTSTFQDYCRKYNMSEEVTYFATLSCDTLTTDTSGINPYRNYVTQQWTFTMKPTRSGTFPMRLGYPGYRYGLFYTNYPGAYFRWSDIKEFQVAYKDQIAEAEEKTNEATSEGDSNSQSSESQNQQASQTIISTMGQVFGAFSTSASNCNLDMDLGNADFGTINLCSGKPAAISAILTPIGTIVMVYAIFLCSRSIFRLFVKISTFAQGGSSNG